MWLERWLGHSRTETEAQEFLSKISTLSSIREMWANIEERQKEFLQNLKPAGLERAVEYTNFQGQRCAYTMQRMLLHVVNHGTYHRGQLTMMLRQLGAVPQPTEFLRYFDLLAEESKA